MPKIENDVMRQIQAFFSTKGLPARFSPTNHRDCHFREESREKVTVLTCKRRTTSLLLVQSACSARNKGVKSMGRRPPRGNEARISRLGWGVLKMSMTGEWPRYLILSLPKMER